MDSTKPLTNRLRALLPVLRTYTDEGGSAYLTRVTWGRSRLHVFHRGDSDPDPHDHPWAFATFPLTSYVEEVTEPAGNGWATRREVVRAFRLHRRPATYLHRVIGRWAGRGTEVAAGGRIVTLVRRSGDDRDWGFLRLRGANACWTPWRAYVLEGGKEAPCGPEA